MPDLFPVKADLSQAANTLVARIADGFGVVYEPTRIRREAKAKAAAAVIAANADEQIAQRAEHRVQIEEIKKQHNLEEIVAKAIPQIEDSARPENVDDDWLTNFFDKAKLTSDEEMQVVWGRLLAGQSNNPGMFTKRTVNLVAEMEKPDAELFTKLAGFMWGVPDLCPMVFDPSDKIYNKSGINFSSLSHLDALGLIKFDNVAGFIRHRPGEMGGELEISYFGSRYRIQFSGTQQFRLEAGKVMLTTQGEELARICNPEINHAFEEYTLQKMRSQGLTVSKI